MVEYIYGTENKGNINHFTIPLIEQVNLKGCIVKDFVCSSTSATLHISLQHNISLASPNFVNCYFSEVVSLTIVCNPTLVASPHLIAM